MLINNLPGEIRTISFTIDVSTIALAVTLSGSQ